MLSIFLPNEKEHLRDASEVFADMYRNVTGKSLPVVSTDDGTSDLVVFGADSDCVFAAKKIIDGTMPAFRLRNGSDDYQIRSVKDGPRTLLFLAGGNVRAYFYAVYDFFERAAGCHYFWDGDVIPHRDSISIDGWDVAEKPRFEYRGLRYFAHRSLKRFQAEHWDFEDWKKEFDWVLKKRMNLTMLRIGIDDLYQRAFPDVVSYPALDSHLPESKPRSFDDRDLFWPLEYRGELRKKVLAYGRSRGLLQPEDCGTMTHWYSRTPKAFLKHFNPGFVPQSAGGYSEDTGLVWDIFKDENLERYFHLTETSVKEYGSPELFHTIGLAERECFPDRPRNHRMKLYAYRRIINRLRQSYPHAPLLIASWDFFCSWKPEEVRALLEEMDPANTLVLEYTVDKMTDSNTFRDWGLIGKFPWIFGIFHAYEASSELRGQFDLIRERFPHAAEDPMCKGVVFWPENSHNDTLMLDYFPSIAWDPSVYKIEDFLPGFCRRRYPENLADPFLSLWTDLLPISQLGRWGSYPDMDTMREVYPDFYPQLGCPQSQWLIGEMNERTQEYFRYRMAEMDPLLPAAASILRRLAAFDFPAMNEFVRRDILDMARTVVFRVLNSGVCRLGYRFEAWRNGTAQPEEIHTLVSLLHGFAADLTKILEASGDFSLNVSLAELKKNREVNPNFEQTLKGNAENQYCRSFIYELSRESYEPALRVVTDMMEKRIREGNKDPLRGLSKFLHDEMTVIQDRFYEKPLAEMAPDIPGAQTRLSSVLRHAAENVEALIGKS